jgi:hypothetical protein
MMHNFAMRVLGFCFNVVVDRSPCFFALDYMSTKDVLPVVGNSAYLIDGRQDLCTNLEGE